MAAKNVEFLTMWSNMVKHPKRCLIPEQEFFLVLVRLRLGLMEVDLATRGGVS